MFVLFQLTQIKFFVCVTPFRVKARLRTLEVSYASEHKQKLDEDDRELIDFFAFAAFQSYVHVIQQP